MKRRDLLLAGVAAALAPTAWAARPDDTLNIGAVGPFREDAKRVYEFLSFSCSFCQQYHDTFVGWGRSIPAPVMFEPVPVVIVSDVSTLNAARAFYSVLRASPRQIDTYCRVVFDAFQRGAGDASDAGLLANAGVDRRAFESAWRSTAVKESIQRAAALTIKYEIAATPTLAIGGTTVLTADMVNGDYAMLMRLASGFVSRVIERG